ncbi:MAG: C40 family peptidase [Rhizobiales bacterium]|nr:C40 family peptidase [Hyphomicrobiales bacterium]
MTPDDVVFAARSAIGTPFVHQGRTVGVGLDCAGLLAYVASELQVKHNDLPAYPRRPSGRMLEATFEVHEKAGVIDRVLVSDMRAGDILMMTFGGDPQHIAISAGDSIIHAWMQPGKVCEHRIDETWRKRIVRVYRFVGVET